MERNHQIAAAKPKLPPGYRFIPMDYELCFLLHNKVNNGPILIEDLKDVDLYNSDPKTLSESYPPLGEKEWYFFTSRNRKYPGGSRPNRIVGGGYWKATVANKEVYFGDKVVGFKKTLVFYQGNHQKGVKTNWIMHEYRVDQSPPSKRDANDNMKLEDWVLCRIHNKASKRKGNQQEDREAGFYYQVEEATYNSQVEEFIDTQVQIVDNNLEEPAASLVTPEFDIIVDKDALDFVLRYGELQTVSDNCQINPVDETTPNPQLVEQVISTQIQIVENKEEDPTPFVNMPGILDDELNAIIDLTDDFPPSLKEILHTPDVLSNKDVFFEDFWTAMGNDGLFEQPTFNRATNFQQVSAYCGPSIIGTCGDSFYGGMANDAEYNQLIPRKRICSFVDTSCFV